MSADDDVLLARRRSLAARFPESGEVEACGRPTSRAGQVALVRMIRALDAGAPGGPGTDSASPT